MLSIPRRLALVIGLVAVVAMPASVSANHSWGSYHWARQSNPFTLKLGDNVSSGWDSYLATTSSDWTVSAVVDTTIVPGGSRSVKLCDATTGRVQVCNSRYGNNGWLGVASIWASGSHITQATVKLNDTYFNTAQYNTPAWRNLVSCQEVGHTLGLDHQDTIFDNQNLDTCMDYTNNPSSNQHPNRGDYDQLLCIYDPATAGTTLSSSTHSCTGTGHLDSSTTVGAAVPNGAAAGTTNSQWGREVARSANGHSSTFVQDLGAGQVIVTFVIWA